MSNTESSLHIREEYVRAGDVPHIVRYMIGISMMLVIIIFSLIFII